MEEDEYKDTRTLGWSRVTKMKANEEEDTRTLVEKSASSLSADNYPRVMKMGQVLSTTLATAQVPLRDVCCVLFSSSCTQPTVAARRKGM